LHCIQGGPVCLAAAGRQWAALAPVPGLGYTQPMSKAPDLESLAKSYLDLWQDQFASMAADPATAEAMARLFGAMAAGWGSPGGAIGGGAGAGDERGSPGHQDGPGAADGTAAAAPSLRNRSDGVPRLLARIAELERRLDALERRSGGTRGGAEDGPRKG
jgi:hypothetical protein